MEKNDQKWLAWAVLATAFAGAIPLLVLKLLGALDTSSDKRLAAVLTLVGVAVTACSALIGSSLRRESERRLAREHADDQARLRLDAAMTAGALFNGNGDSPADPAGMASGLLALTQLERAGLAVALLVDLWDEGAGDSHREQPSARVSDETAILVLDAALRSTNSNAQLVAAELLCRNAARLDICQSLHWPACVDGTWNAAFGVKTKVLIVDALVRMAYESDPSLNALQSLAVRLYAISSEDPDVHVKGCIGMLLGAIAPTLEGLNVRSLMQGPSEVTIEDIKMAADRARANPDRVFYRVVHDRRTKLIGWANSCHTTDLRPGALAAAAVSATGPVGGPA